MIIFYFFFYVVAVIWLLVSAYNLGQRKHHPSTLAAAASLCFAFIALVIGTGLPPDQQKHMFNFHMVVALITIVLSIATLVCNIVQQYYAEKEKNNGGV